jgi:hypothetical protein
MVNKNSKSEANAQNKTASEAIMAEGVVEVLYQKLGDRWFAFSVVDEEVFVGSVPADSMRHFGDPTPQTKKRSGNS